MKTFKQVDTLSVIETLLNCWTSHVVGSLLSC